MVKTNPFGALAEVGGALVAVGLLVLMLVVVEVRPAGATFPGNSGRIAYQSDQDGDLEIYTIDPTGGTPFQVTNNTTSDGAPSYSPDGTKIAYLGVDDSNPFQSEIFTISATGGTPVQLTHSSADGRRRWSILRDQRELRGHLADLRHGPRPARRRRRGDRGGVHG